MVAEQSNVTISCRNQHNSTVYQVLLERLPAQQPWLIIGVCKKVDMGLLREDYSDRGVVSCGDELDVSLQLSDVQPEDAGLYRCRFSTDAGERSVMVLLRVPTAGRTSEHAAVPLFLSQDAAFIIFSLLF